MSVFAVVTYNVIDPERFSQYIPGSAGIVFSTLAKHGGELIFADGNAVYVAGEVKTMNVCVKFPTAEAFQAWENDPDYAEAKVHREASTENYTVFIAQEFIAPQ